MLPHDAHPKDLDRLYPELTAPEDEDIDESIFMPRDYLAERGEIIAEEIMQEALAHGRRRVLEPEAQHGPGGPGRASRPSLPRKRT